jgi:hypothetical protein
MVKYFEVRDRATFIPVVCTELKATTDQEYYLLRRVGFGGAKGYIALHWLTSARVTTEPYDWGTNPRTMYVAHQHIEENWDNLTTGDVIDVEFILGECDTKKVSEAFE